MYCIQLYCDFSGGIDITRGVAGMLGIEMAENFRPADFRRLPGRLLAPLAYHAGAMDAGLCVLPAVAVQAVRASGQVGAEAHRRAAGKIFATSLATFVVYLIIGIWHGANFRYLAFGLWNGTLITASLLLERRFPVLEIGPGHPGSVCRLACGTDPSDQFSGISGKVSDPGAAASDSAASHGRHLHPAPAVPASGRYASAAGAVPGRIS